MPVIDSSELSAHLPAKLLCDVCIIGTGPAGATIARELSNGPLRVTVLESGGYEREPQADALNAIENIGRPRKVDQWLVRNRIVGGSSHTWTGRCAPFDEIDFESRDWVPNSGWPFGPAELAPFLERTADYLGLGAACGIHDDRVWELIGHRRPRTRADPNSLSSIFWQYSRDVTNPYDYMRFGKHLPGQLGTNVSLVTNATVVGINSSESRGAVESIEFVGLDRRRWILPATTVVLATGGIENARLLLASGLGNDLVGRHLMDHPRGPVAKFRVEDGEPVLNRFGVFNTSGRAGNRYQHGVRLSPAIQRAERLQNAAAWIGEVVSDDDPWNALKRILRGKPNLRDLGTIASNPNLFVRGFYEYYFRHNGLPRKIEALTLDVMCEQRPDPDSRVTLSNWLDQFGSPLARVDWRLHEEDSRATRRLAQLVVEEFPKMGLNPPVLEEWVLDGAELPTWFTDIAHPTGATRMSHNPSNGVVDVNSEVHGVRGLFVAGSSVFPTSGHANPTQMIVAMALRLADTLKLLKNSSPIAERAAERGKESVATRDLRERNAQTKILVTGATGNIGRHVIQELLVRGYAVRAVTSKPVKSTATEPGLEWRQLDFQESLEFAPLVAGCNIVLHLAAELSAVGRMQRINVEAPRALAKASEDAGVRVFIHTSTISVYGSSESRHVTEESPVLTLGSDTRSEYLAAAPIRAYGRTKRQGEIEITKVARNVEYAIVRPTVVVSIDGLAEIGNWSTVRKFLTQGRHAHHIYVDDVADALLWLMERGIRRERARPGVSIYNLADDDISAPTLGGLFRDAYTASGDRRWIVPPAPWQVDWLRAAAQFRTVPRRHTLGRMLISGEKLRLEGWSPRYGMAAIRARFLIQLQSDRRGDLQ